MKNFKPLTDGDIYQNQNGFLYLVVHDHVEFSFAPVLVKFLYSKKKVIDGFFGRRNFLQFHTKVGKL